MKLTAVNRNGPLPFGGELDARDTNPQSAEIKQQMAVAICPARGQNWGAKATESEQSTMFRCPQLWPDRTSFPPVIGGR